MSAWEENIIRKPEGVFLRCWSCNTEHLLYNPEKAVLFGCPVCNKISSAEHASYRKLNPGNDKGMPPFIPLRSKGVFDGVSYTVTGRAVKREKLNRYATWEEYVLLDDKGEHVFLNQSGGHWTLMRPVSAPSEYDRKADQILNDDGLVYEYFSGYYQMTNHFVGEFPYDVLDIKKVFSKDFISPPFILSVEDNGKQLNFFSGKYISPRKIRKAFSPAGLVLPSREGVGVCQPFYFGIHPTRFALLSLFFVLLVWTFYFAAKSEPLTEPLITGTLTNDSLPAARHLVTPAFRVDDGPVLLRIDGFCQMNNMWAEAEMTLVNETTGTERTFYNGIEYYSGFDDEGGWSEGSTSNTVYLNNVETGIYHVETNLATPAYGTHLEFKFGVYQDDPSAWNLGIVILTLVILSVVMFLLKNRFENKRNE